MEMLKNANNNIYLVGPMAAGKSTVGRALARKLRRDFFDTDHEIIECTGVQISLIFELEGEAGFRKREAEKLALLSLQKSVVIATGGGIVLSAENLKVVKQTGLVIYLTCSIDQQLKRTRSDTQRPLLQIADPRKKLEELMVQREPLYESVADIKINTEKGNLRNTVNEIISQLKRINDNA